MKLSHHRGGSGEPLVLIHGIGSTWRAFKPVIPALEQRFDVLGLDLPGFGDSPPLEPGLEASMPVLTDHVEAAMDDAGFATAHVAGNSMGGWIAFELARRGRARTVTALSPAGMWTPKENAFAQSQLKAGYVVWKLIAPYAHVLTRSAVLRTLLYSGAFARPWKLDPDETAYATRTLVASSSWHSALEWMNGRICHGLGDVRCPVTIAWGTRDRLLLPRQGPRFVRYLPDAELRELKGLGHLPMSDDPQMVVDAIVATTERSPVMAAAAAS